jgi:hypothetical protein
MLGLSILVALLAGSAIGVVAAQKDDGAEAGALVTGQFLDSTRGASGSRAKR